MIVYIITKLELGGAQKVCLALMNGLVSNNVPTGLISGNEGILVPETKKFETVFLLPSFRRELKILGIFSELKILFKLIKILKKLRKEHGFLVVHTHSTKAGILGRWAAFFARVSTRIHTVHGFGFHAHQKFLPWLCVYLCEFVTSLITTHFVCVSDKDRKTGMRYLPAFAKKSSIIRAAVAGEQFQPASRVGDMLDSSAPFIIGTVSCFKPQKNLFDLLQAFKLVYHNQVSVGRQAPLLHIIGDGEQRQAIELWIAAEKLTNVITLLGWQEDVASWMKTWNLFALSSLWEGLPCAIIEARLCKLPVIAYNIDGIPEVIFSGKNGFLEKPGNWQGLASRMLETINNPELLKTLRLYQDNLSDFDNKTMVKKHLELYSDVKASP